MPDYGSEETRVKTITADEYAELLRAHTLAIWALKGELDYPEDERSAMGRKAMEVIARARRDEAGHVMSDGESSPAREERVFERCDECAAVTAAGKPTRCWKCPGEPAPSPSRSEAAVEWEIKAEREIERLKDKAAGASMWREQAEALSARAEGAEREKTTLARRAEELERIVEGWMTRAEELERERDEAQQRADDYSDTADMRAVEIDRLRRAVEAGVECARRGCHWGCDVAIQEALSDTDQEEEARAR